MFITFTVFLYLISVTIGKHTLLITQFKNDEEIPIRSSLVTASIGDNVSFHCKIVGNDTSNKPGVKWVTAPSNNFKFAENDSSTIILSPLKQEDRGTYACVSKTQKLSANVFLFVKPGRKRANFNKHQEEILTFEELKKLEDSVISNKDLPPLYPHYWNSPIPEPIDIAKLDIDRAQDFRKFINDEPKIINTSTYTTFKQSVYIVPVTILVILSLVRLCYHLGNRGRVPWQQLSAPSCNHQICAHRRRTNPAASCILSRANSRLSVLIIQRATNSTSDSTTNPVVNESDVPPAYNDVNSNDSPPTYSEALQNMKGTSSNGTTNGTNSNVSI